MTDFVKDGWLTDAIDHQLLAIDADVIAESTVPDTLILRALQFFSPQDTRVVILGQDPYHTASKANGLAFGVSPHYKGQLGSLGNIIKESGAQDKSLVPWARQGVLLLNTILTVKKGEPLSHASVGWQPLVKDWLRMIPKDVPFLLLGAEARTFFRSMNLVNPFIYTSHPSPLSASKGDYPFRGSRCFERINEYFSGRNQALIDWSKRDGT